MKPIYYLLLLVLIGCKKELTLQDQIIGRWELRTRFGGFGTTTSYPAGNGNIIEFTNTTYLRYNNGQLNESSSYTLADTIWHGRKGGVVHYGTSIIPSFVIINNSILSIDVMSVDAGGDEYQKLR
ncbi:MAG: hypothetical protein Q8941_16675 [Bacteroidota bacterium]|nr:hypothetical protein [Bacteroidota bacterium]